MKNKNNNKKKGNENFKKSPITKVYVLLMKADNAAGLLELPQFTVSVKCGGGTYIRSLMRDIR